MGNWRTVNIVGSCDAGEVAILNAVLGCRGENGYQGMGCLSSCGGICGLPLWGAQNISAKGNMAERDYDEQDVKRFLEQLVPVAPSLAVIVHVGGDYESLEVVASVVLENGVATIHEPMQKTLDAIPEEDMDGRLMAAILNAKRMQ